MHIRKNIIIFITIIFIAILALLYRSYNPETNSYYPKCPFKQLTGLKCPGCGSQRAIHYVLNLDINNAMKENIVLVIFIPYLLLGLIFDRIKKPNNITLKYRRILFGHKAIIIILFLIMGFWALRNITH